jgi:hypothetical protein
MYLKNVTNKINKLILVNRITFGSKDLWKIYQKYVICVFGQLEIKQQLIEERVFNIVLMAQNLKRILNLSKNARAKIDVVNEFFAPTVSSKMSKLVFGTNVLNDRAFRLVKI